MRLDVVRHRSLGCVAVGVATCWSTTAAFAICGMPQIAGGGSGPPSISATETSTTQVLEQVRRRTQAVEEQQLMQASNTTATAASNQAQTQSQATASAEGNASPPAAAESGAKPAKKMAKSKAVAAEPEPEPVAASNTGYVSFKDDRGDPYAAAPSRSMGAWVQGFMDRERHENLAPGNQENPTRNAHTEGGVAGVDWTHVTHGDVVDAVQIGAFVGRTNTSAKFSDTQFTFKDPAVGGFDEYTRVGSKEDVDGPFVGAYAALVHDKFTADVTFKADFLDISAQSTLLQTTCHLGTPDDIGHQTGTGSLTDYVVAGNVAYRVDMSPHSWIEPTMGFRYTLSDFGNSFSSVVFDKGPNNPNNIKPGGLGLVDGSSLRLQWGARLGQIWQLGNGAHLITTLGGFLYSDVMINGYTFTTLTAGPAGETVGPVDEGKVRALGEFTAKLDAGNGVTYLLEAQVHGGEDVFGYGGQIGMRYEW